MSSRAVLPQLSLIHFINSIFHHDVEISPPYPVLDAGKLAANAVGGGGVCVSSANQRQPDGDHADG